MILRNLFKFLAICFLGVVVGKLGAAWYWALEADGDREPFDSTKGSVSLGEAGSSESKFGPDGEAGNRMVEYFEDLKERLSKMPYSEFSVLFEAAGSEAERRYLAKTYIVENPKEGLRFLTIQSKNLRGRSAMIEAALRNVAKSDETFALRWLDENLPEDPRVEEKRLEQVMFGWAERDPIASGSYFVENRDRFGVSGRVVATLTNRIGEEEGVIRMIEWVDGLPNDVDKGAGIRSGIDKLVLEEPDLAVDWLITHQSIPAARIEMIKPFRKLAIESVDSAVEALDRVPEKTSARYNATHAIASHWYKVDKDAAKIWFDTMDQVNDSPDGAAVAFSMESFELAPEESAQWLLRIRNPTLATRAFEKLSNKLYDFEGRSFLRKLEEEGVPLHLKEAFENSVRVHGL